MEDDGVFALLDAEAQAAVTEIVAEARAKGAFAAKPFRSGDVYAYPHPDGGIAWGLNGGRDGFCIARGIAKD